ncbi:MAG: sugar ABC transporter permease, partial [Clostridiales bacterium]|nr:sugar ABC transporter permease [Clostridiales bacterium]
FVYTMGIRNARYPFSTAVGLFGSLLNLFFLVSANMLTKRLSGGEGGLW